MGTEGVALRCVRADEVRASLPLALWVQRVQVLLADGLDRTWPPEKGWGRRHPRSQAEG